MPVLASSISSSSASSCISALLAAVRGFTREVLSHRRLGRSAAAAAWYLHPMALPLAKQYISNNTVADRGGDRRHLRRHADRRVDHHGEDLRPGRRFAASAPSTGRSASSSAPRAAC